MAGAPGPAPRRHLRAPSTAPPTACTSRSRPALAPATSPRLPRGLVIWCCRSANVSTAHARQRPCKAATVAAAAARVRSTVPGFVSYTFVGPHVPVGRRLVNPAPSVSGNGEPTYACVATLPRTGNIASAARLEIPWPAPPRRPNVTVAQPTCSALSLPPRNSANKTHSLAAVRHPRPRRRTRSRSTKKTNRYSVAAGHHHHHHHHHRRPRRWSSSPTGRTCGCGAACTEGTSTPTRTGWGCPCAAGAAGR